jgi:hypothetical protein
MRGRPFTMTWRPDDSPEVLKAAYLSERDGLIRTRLQALRSDTDQWPTSTATSLIHFDDESQSCQWTTLRTRRQEYYQFGLTVPGAA